MDMKLISKVKNNLEKINSMMYLTSVAANTEDIGANQSLINSLYMMYDLLQEQIDTLESVKEKYNEI